MAKDGWMIVEYFGLVICLTGTFASIFYFRELMIELRNKRRKIKGGAK